MTRPPFDARLEAARAALSAAAERKADVATPAPPPRPDVYFAAVAFTRNAEGELVAGRAIRQPSAGAAEGAARRMAETADGAIAFSRAGDATRGIFDDMVVLRAIGDIPTLEPKTKPP